MIDAKKVLLMVVEGGSLDDYLIGVQHTKYGHGELAGTFGSGWVIGKNDKPDTWYLKVFVKSGQKIWSSDWDVRGSNDELDYKVYFYELD